MNSPQAEQGFILPLMLFFCIILSLFSLKVEELATQVRNDVHLLEVKRNI